MLCVSILVYSICCVLSKSWTLGEECCAWLCAAKLNSCLELMRNILGENFAEATMMTTAIESGFSVEQSINQLLDHHSRTISVTCTQLIYWYWWFLLVHQTYQSVARRCSVWSNRDCGPDYGCIHNQQSEWSDLSDEIDPVQWKRTPSWDFITVTHTTTSLYPIIPQFLWLAIWNWLLECLLHVSWAWLTKILRFLAMKSDFFRCIRADRIDWIFDYECNQSSPELLSASVHELWWFCVATFLYSFNRHGLDSIAL